ncbi:PRELI-like family-domain-containing protein [Pyronema domesticum]|uniref:Similar to Protein UPS2, mitochondrial acc. no. P35200 n=1 Tax=Pyronema omphalodes (strain CBS 100304) TaxID=1076935 RepID=U4LLS8_PYROM|nr:PRELI-like family-domain-containing protein [Pyronema domesticum]CCX32547.1 Similar to Protein UPS2, mitochondrial; acc. no. P35200 [Pyronema omphalodes CBS 100304]
MRVFENNCTFDYPWDNVSIANWRKYCAWNTQSSHVVAVDTLSRFVDPNSGILHSERLITCKQNAPRWLLKLTGAEVSYVREVSEVDPRSQTVTLRSINLTGCNVVSVQETVVYSPHPDDPTRKTLFTQGAQITAYGAFTRICNKIEEWSVERFGQNAQKGRMGFEAVLEMSAKVFREMKEGNATTTA